MRIALSIIIPSIILAYFGLLKEYFLFPLATSFVGLTDMAGPYIRRRNALFLSAFFFISVMLLTSSLTSHPILVGIEIIILGIFFTMLGVYGQRLAAVGGLSLVVLSIFTDKNISGDNNITNILVFSSGCFWFILVFLIVTKIQPYKLASQMIGENYIKLGEYLKIKAKFYEPNIQIDELYREVIAQQVIIKNLQEETREVVFKTRKIVNESTTTSRLLMLMFLNSIDFYEKLMTSDQDYNKMNSIFGNSKVIKEANEFLNLLSDEVTHIGIALQSGTKTNPIHKFPEKLQQVYSEYFKLRKQQMHADNFESFMMLRLILQRIRDVSKDVETIYKFFTQDLKNIQSLSSGLDLKKFVPKQEKLRTKILIDNLSLQSSHFRHSIRLTLALLLGYVISQISYFEIGYSYWILITIIAIMRPAYSTTKHRNLLRIYGTISGGLFAYFFLILTQNETLHLVVLFTSMLLCFTLMKDRYAISVFFMTIYIFVTFNYLHHGNVNILFKDRLVDTAIAAVLVAFVSYFILPVWEHSQNIKLMIKSTQSNFNYFNVVIEKIKNKTPNNDEYRVARKDAIINLANLSDNFQRMLSDPKNQQRKLEYVHQFVTTSHLITAYTASLSQYSKSIYNFKEIDFVNWKEKIKIEFNQSITLLNKNASDLGDMHSKTNIIPEDSVQNMLSERKEKILANEVYDVRDTKSISKLAELRNIQEILELVYDVVHEQRKISERFIADREHF